MKNKIIAVIILMTITINFSAVAISNIPLFNYITDAEETDNNNKYKESMDILTNNPHRGFYRTESLTLKESDNEAKDFSSPTSKLVFLHVDISSFSGAQNGSEDKELSQDALNALDTTL